MRTYSLITTMNAPNREAAENAFRAGFPAGATLRGHVIEGDAQAIIDDLMTALYALEFHDPDAPVNGGDAVEAICERFDDLRLLTTVPAPDLDDDDDEEDDVVYTTRDDVVAEIERLLGDGGTRELAERVYTYMREQGMVEHNGQGLVIERDSNVFQIAADLSRIGTREREGYRAAYWTDGQSSVRLTSEEQQDWPDSDLKVEAQREADLVGLEIGDGQIVIGHWID